MISRRLLGHGKNPYANYEPAILLPSIHGIIERWMCVRNSNSLCQFESWIHELGSLASMSARLIGPL